MKSSSQEDQDVDKDPDYVDVEQEGSYDGSIQWKPSYLISYYHLCYYHQVYAVYDHSQNAENYHQA